MSTLKKSARFISYIVGALVSAFLVVLLSYYIGVKIISVFGYNGSKDSFSLTVMGFLSLLGFFTLFIWMPLDISKSNLEYYNLDEMGINKLTYYVRSVISLYWSFFKLIIKVLILPIVVYLISYVLANILPESIKNFIFNGVQGNIWINTTLIFVYIMFTVWVITLLYALMYVIIKGIKWLWRKS